MSGFSPDWLALREPVDHRSRDKVLAARLEKHFAGRDRVAIVDLGCGAGSNIRATSALLPAKQNWTLVDYDPRLLQAARATLMDWACSATVRGDALLLMKFGKSLHVSFRQCDLNRDLAAALGENPDLVTASALFDLCSGSFIRACAEAVARRRAVFYTVLTYNGQMSWRPAHPDDGLIEKAFNGHQLGDKGFGPADGYRAPQTLAAAFEAAGYTVEAGDSPWVLEAADQKLLAEVTGGLVNAVGERDVVHPDTVAAWARAARTGGRVGHTDTLALPAG